MVTKKPLTPFRGPTSAYDKKLERLKNLPTTGWDYPVDADPIVLPGDSAPAHGDRTDNLSDKAEVLPA